MQKIDDFAVADDHGVVLHAGGGEGFDGGLRGGIAAAVEAEAFVGQAEPAGDQVEAQRFELPAYGAGPAFEVKRC